MNNAKNTLIQESMSVQSTSIDGLYLIKMKQVTESRGTIREFFRKSAFSNNNINCTKPWVQINITETRQGAIRGLHGENMQKLVAVVDGEAFGVYVDMRPGSVTRGVVFTAKLVKGTQVYIPKGVCNGFQSVSEGVSQYAYCFDAEWAPGMPGYSINPLDQALGISWPIPVTESDFDLISRKDASAPSFEEALGR
ncbi:MAG: dTDP-4-dehydrorhamnose 3,5-epimerase [Candidatus Babeliales bacterium]|jgi:dTDP-4-dehydrorhamnose 3,5-epimerase